MFLTLFKKYSLLIVFTLITSLTSGITNAQQTTPKHDGWYKVEMIIFAKADYKGAEQFPTNISLTYPNNWLELIDPAQSSAITTTDAAKAVYLLTEKDQELTAQAQRFARSSRYKLLFHRSWRQYITNIENSSGLLINAGQLYDKHHELEGSITLSVATYLQLKTNLWFTEFEPYNDALMIGAPNSYTSSTEPNNNSASTPMDSKSLTQEQPIQTTDLPTATIVPQWPKLPTSPNIFATQATQLAAGVSLPTEHFLSEQKFMPKRIVLMQEERDMRSNEVHYVDHPLLGIIVKIRPSGL